MCGIVAVIGSREAAPLLLDGLRQLEYRGYDSAGIATLETATDSNKGHILCKRAKGKLNNLAGLYERQISKGRVGIGHTK